MVINCTCLHVLGKCVSERGHGHRCTPASTQSNDAIGKPDHGQKARIKNGTPNCIKIPLFLTFE